MIVEKNYEENSKTKIRPKSRKYTYHKRVGGTDKLKFEPIDLFYKDGDFSEVEIFKTDLGTYKVVINEEETILFS